MSSVAWSRLVTSFARPAVALRGKVYKDRLNLECRDSGIMWT